MGVSKREIDIVIAPDGTVSLEVVGAKGAECLDLTEFLEEALGEVVDREYTREYYQTPTETTEQIKIGNG